MAKKPNVAEVTVEIYTDAIKAHLEERLASAVEAAFEHTLAEMIEAKVGALIDEIGREHVKKAVVAALDEGWQETNNYGEPTGKKLGVKGRIAALLDKQEGDYNKRMTRADKIAGEVIDSALRDQFGEELKAARDRFKKQLDDVVAAKFTETIKSALGLR